MTKEIDWKKINKLAKLSIEGDKLAYREFLISISSYLEVKIRKAVPEAYWEDSYQETLLAIHKSLKSLDTTKDCKAWLNSIAHYKICDQLRMIYQAKNLDYGKSEDIAEKEWSPVEAKSVIRKMLSGLTKIEGQILLMLKIEEQSIADVAETLKLSPSNVKVISFRAIRKLRERISKEEFYG